MSQTCLVAGCGDVPRGRGLCSRHYQRWRTYGDPTHIKTGRGLPLADRFWRFVEKTETCWLWTSRHNAKGYAMFSTSTKRGAVLAHRFAYEIVVGPVPDGLELDHACEVKRCVNPAHLEPVTRAENMRRISERRERRRTDLAAANRRIAELEEQLRDALEEVARLRRGPAPAPGRGAA